MNIVKIAKHFFQGVVIGLIGIVAGILLLDHFGIYQTAKPFVVMSGSMEPAVPVGSVVLVRPQAGYAPGDVISFAAQGNQENIVTHRIVFRRYLEGLGSDPVYNTAGDANEEMDKWEVTSEQIVGKVLFYVPYIGYGVDFVKQPFGFILLVIVPATIVIYEELKVAFGEFLKFIKKLTRKIGGGKKRNLRFKLTWLNSSSNKDSSLPKMLAIVPIIGATLAIATVTGSWLMDSEFSLGNILSAATSFGPEYAGQYLMENKDSSWNIIEDDIFGVLDYDIEAPTFNYQFQGYGLNPTIDFCLIYYADGYPGNNPGAYIDHGVPDSTGYLTFSSSKDLGISLPEPPDANYPGGAKVWLLPCSQYNQSTRSVIGWGFNSTDWLVDKDTLLKYTRVIAPSPTPTDEPSPTPTPGGTTINFENLGATSQYGYVHDYSTANVSFNYNTPSLEKLSGTITASGLKPYATYQLKFEGTPTCQDAGGDDALNEYIGSIGRWWDNTSNTNASDAQKASNPSHCYTGYLVWDHITADTSGNVTKSVETANSYHVLWCGGGACDTNNNSQLQNTDGSVNPPGFPYCAASDVNGDIERFSCGGLTLEPGVYNLKFILNEESFHQSSYGTWTAVMDTVIDFEILENHVVINEILPNPDVLNATEWVELYNPTGSSVDLTNWSLVDAANSSKDLSALGNIPEGGFKVYYYSGGEGWLNNTGSETLRLRDASSTVIDEHTYSGSSNDVSVGRLPDASTQWKNCIISTEGASNNGGC